MRSLNPGMLYRAAKEYRYEVGEGRMGFDCLQYLNQIQAQWNERIKSDGQDSQATPAGTPLKRELNLSELSTTNSNTESELSALSETMRMIDESFSDRSRMEYYIPPRGEESSGELLNSRYMVGEHFLLNRTLQLTMIFVRPISCPSR